MGICALGVFMGIYAFRIFIGICKRDIYDDFW